MRLSRCVSCGRRAFPPRLWCPDCGGASWEPVDVREGVVETVTTTRDGERAATVVPEGAPPVLALVEGDASPGTRVALEDAPGAPVARPLPQ